MDYLLQCEAKKLMGKTKWGIVNHSKTWSASEEFDAVYLMGLEGLGLGLGLKYCKTLLQAPSAKSDL